MAGEERGLIKTALFLALGVGSRFYRDLNDWKDELIAKGENEWKDWKGEDQATKKDIMALKEKIEGVAEQTAKLLKF
jgi:hypothetical protein